MTATYYIIVFAAAFVCFMAGKLLSARTHTSGPGFWLVAILIAAVVPPLVTHPAGYVASILPPETPAVFFGRMPVNCLFNFIFCLWGFKK